MTFTLQVSQCRRDGLTMEQRHIAKLAPCFPASAYPDADESLRCPTARLSATDHIFAVAFAIEMVHDNSLHKPCVVHNYGLHDTALMEGGVT